MGALVLSGNTLYGATIQGGVSGGGTVFAVNTDGTGFKVLHAFSALENGTNSDGSYAQEFFMNGSEYIVEQNPGLVLSDGVLYGTTASGGLWGGGAVFAMNIDGSGFTNLHSLNPTSTDGHYPHGGLVLSGHRLYGTTGLYGTTPLGNVFTIGTDGTGFTNVHTFSYSDGVGPNGLTLSGDTLFGTTYVGGGSPFSTPYGTVFSLQADGTNFKVLYNFSNGTDGDPREGVVVSDGNVYGITPGLVFKVSADGTGFWILHRFESTGGPGPSGLILSGNTLYGTTLGSGSAGGGTLFTVNTDGTGFTNLYSFTPATPSGVSPPFSYTNSQGANPGSELVLSGTTFYGTTQIGGSGGSGTVFKIFFPPQLSILPAGSNLILTWPTNAVGFTLQVATNLVSQTVWTNLPQFPIVLNGQNLVVLPVSGARQFYRLKQ
jgi:uncharacterized repeat protein (TIGR03803 family)